jgi:23S rRNA (uracil1939-C5)-methyltransferase
MVVQALEWLEVEADERVLDLFCGLGNFSLPLAKLAERVVGVEGVDDMVIRAKANAELNKLDNTEFVQANLEQALTDKKWASAQFDKVLLDPARAGAAGVIEQLSALGAKRVVYVSCNPATLARDSQSLLQQGYTLEKLGMLDMFPHTSHLESMALFVR